MKKIVIFLVFVLFAGSAIGADGPKREYKYGDVGYFGTIRANYMIWDSYGSAKGVSVDFINGRSYNPWFMMGGGIGVIYTNFPPELTSDEKSHSTIRVPVYLHLRTNLLDRRVSPFLAVNLGCGICRGYIEKHPYQLYTEQMDASYVFLYEEVQLGAAVRLKGGRMIDFGLSFPFDFGLIYCMQGGLKFSLGFTW